MAKKLFRRIKEVFDKIFRRRAQKPPVRKEVTKKVLPNGNEVINGREYLSPSAGKALQNAFHEQNPNLVGGRPWN